MKYEKFLEENWFKIIVAFSCLVVTFSVLFYFVLHPIQKDKPIRECLETMEKSIGDAKIRTENAFKEGKINEQKRSESITNLNLSSFRMEDECYKNFKD